MKSVTRRTIGPILAVLTLLLLGGSSAWATPFSSFSNLSISPSSPFNSIKAVCSPATNITFSVDVTPTFDPINTCVNTATSGPAVKVRAAGGGTLTGVTANGVPLSNTSGSTWSGTISVGSEGLNTITVIATATDSVTTTSCSPGGNNATGTSTDTSAKYVTDQQAPTLEIQAYAPGPVDPSPIPQIHAGEAITVHTQLTDGSSGTAVSITLSTSAGPGTIDPFTDDTDTFGGPSGPNDNGKAPTKNNSIALQTLCSTTPGIYTMRVDADTKDLCGNFFPTITKDPAKTHDGDSGNDPSGTFEVLSPVSLSTITHVISEFPGGDYGIDQCFTSVAGKKKLANNPGSVHIAAVVTSTVPGDCSDLTIANPKIVLTLPLGFGYLLTGGSPAAHVFIGEGTGFDLHNPVGFTEVTASAGITVSGNTITVDLSSVDVGPGPGVIPTGLTIYARAHAVYSGPGAPSADTSFGFTTMASANVGALTASHTETIVGNPSAGCVDGTLP